ncbi:39S ribosomal protein L3, mitochondrial-like [Drosophila miranda]|uniref:39S ribosomal protein L3, mitochondrial-like n=1 Tax=Drosophila miranda TaxID=7229 RepID=UPI00143FAB2F|nr:39S ribosomal protein L3, mitochondrial-like [Drosophila miranda]
MIQSVVFQLARLRLGSCIFPSPQVRGKGYLSRPRLRNPYWNLRKERTNTEDFVTAENQHFVNELVYDKYDTPALIKTIQAHANKFIQTYDPEDGIRPWTPQTRRCGVIARKIGQYPLWLKNGKKVRTTLLQIVDNHVIKYMPHAECRPQKNLSRVHNSNQYGCLLVGAESTNPSMLTKEYCGIFRDAGVVPKKNIMRFMVSPDGALAPGTPLNISRFRVGEYVDVRGKTVDHGFQGVVKRHGYKGMPASHGVTKTHRRPGNIGGGGEKGRVWPGTKMPGHMGNRWRVLKGLRIWRTNAKYNVMWVQGSSVPGPTGGLVYIYDTILPLRKLKQAPPFPTFCGEVDTTFEDIWYEQMHKFKDETIIYKSD